MKFSTGQPVVRIEDRRLLVGAGQFVDDITRPRQAFGVVLRSPHAHAVLRRIDAGEAASLPGVLAVLTAAEAAADGITGIPCEALFDNRDGTPIKAPSRPVLAAGKVRHVGEPVAFVVAETLAVARDAADAILVDYDPLPVVTDVPGALAEGAPRLFDDIPGNLSVDFDKGDAAAVERAFGRAAHVTRLTVVNNRVVVTSMEPRGAIGAYDAGSGRYTLYSPSQGAHAMRDTLANTIFRVPRHRTRVVTGDVGGGFGMKAAINPEHVLVVWAARRLGRPVKWISDRAEAFLSDTQGRDQVNEIELALDGDARFLALRVRSLGNLGAYASAYGPFVLAKGGTHMLSGAYAIPAIYTHVRCAVTNTVPTDAYRGAGRPEATYLLERVVDAAARELGLSPAEIRRRNFIRPEQMPYTTASGPTYDSGEFERNLDDALQLADWSGIEARRTEARTRGHLRGIGLCTYVEACGGGAEEFAELRLEADGSATLLVGSQDNGQGHGSAFAQIIADGLSLPIERIRVVQGDSDQIPFGNGTGGSRMLAVAGNSVRIATDGVIAKGKRIASTLLEAAEVDLEFVDGDYRVAGTDRKVTLAEVAKTAYSRRKAGADAEFGLMERAAYLPKASTFPNGCHVCEVEVDPETGSVVVVGYWIVDDFGTVLNPLTLTGQIHGGTVQGIGQALFEDCRYDPESGQLLSGSMMDYGLPHAVQLPGFAVKFNEVPCRTNPLGVKGAGEAGAIGAPPAVINAVLDALAPLGVKHIDMPATPERVWRAIQDAQRPA